MKKPQEDRRYVKKDDYQIYLLQKYLQKERKAILKQDYAEMLIGIKLKDEKGNYHFKLSQEMLEESCQEIG